MKEYRYIYEDGKLPAAFRAIPFFQAFDHRCLRDMLVSSRVRAYDRGEHVMREGDRDRWLYILLAGRVSVDRHGEPLAELDQPGEVFGELAALNADERTASVTAASPAVCLAIDTAFVEKLDPREKSDCYFSIYRILVTVLSVRLKATSEGLSRAEAELREWRERGGCAAAAQGGQDHGTAR
jgi:CRP/FNR family transcriptional regulator, cyclic AMP receptor protein